MKTIKSMVYIYVHCDIKKMKLEWNIKNDELWFYSSPSESVLLSSSSCRWSKWLVLTDVNVW